MKKWLWVVVVSLGLVPVHAQLQRAYEYGVSPTDNVTSLELSPTLNVIDDSAGISSSQLTLKMYRVVAPDWNWGVEVPLSRFESRAKSESGLGDISVAVNWMHPESTSGGFGYGAKMEMTLPTATDKLLGSGQLQASPSVFALWSFPNGIYIAGGYKHYASVIGDHARDEINMGRFRLNLSYLSDDKWWIQSNLYYYQDFKNTGKMEVIPELEVGTLINQGTAVYVNASTHAAGNWNSKDWSVGVGFKVLYL